MLTAIHLRSRRNEQGSRRSPLRKRRWLWPPQPRPRILRHVPPFPRLPKPRLLRMAGECKCIGIDITKALIVTRTPCSAQARAKALLESAGITDALAFDEIAAPTAAEISSQQKQQVFEPAAPPPPPAPAPAAAAAAATNPPAVAVSASPKPMETAAPPPPTAQPTGSAEEEAPKKGGWGFGWPFGKKK